MLYATAQAWGTSSPVNSWDGIMVSQAVVLVALLKMAAPAALPSVAVLNLEYKQGVTADVADLLTVNLTATLRSGGRFSRVVGTRDMEQVIGFEKQKQLLSCESASCMAELAGALGVDFLLTGSLGRLGTTWLFNATMINTRSGVADATVSKRIKGQNEEALLDAVDQIAAELIHQAHLDEAVPAAAAPKPVAAAPAPKPVAPEPAPAPKPAAPVASASPATTAPAPAADPAPAPAAAEEPAAAGAKGGGFLGKALMGVGGVGLALGALALVGGLAGLATSLGTFAALTLNKNLLVGTGMGTAVTGVYVGGYVLAGVGVVLALVGGVAGVALLGSGFFLN